MRRWAMSSLALALIAMPACDENCANPLVTPPDAAPPTSSEALWVLQQPFPDVANLNGVWGYSHDDVWAVGSAGTILHYDGTTWTRVPSPTTQDLFGIDGHETMQDGDKDIYAVGASGTVIHWDGVVWAPEPAVPDLRKTNAGNVVDTLMGVWHGGREGVFAVGEEGTVLQKKPDPGDPQAPYTWGLMIEEMVQNRMPVCEARVAYDADGYPFAGTGSTCQPCNIAPPRDSSGNLVTNDDGSPLPQSMWMCSASGSATVRLCQGPDYDPVDCEVPSTMRRGDTAQCSFGQRCQADGVSPAYQVNFYLVDFKAVVGFGSGADLRVIAVGESGAVVELRPNGTSGAGATWNCEGLTPTQTPASCWRPVARAGSTDNPAVRDSLAGVWGTWSTNVHAVGEDGRILWRNGDDEWVRGSDVTQAEWIRTFLTPPTPVFLRALWHQGRDDFFVAGFSGVVLHHSGGQWLVEQVPTTAHLRAIWGKTRDDLDAGSRDAEAPALRSVFVVGSEGVILKRSISQ
ncbi:MAG: hypothetical protein ABIJ09_15300 [Pseudomonadota bacterium]